MDCSMIQEELVAFVFGTSTDDERGRIDAHLLACNACLRAYLRLKHHVERGAAMTGGPSDAVRSRVRADVAAIVRPAPGARVRRWLRRPIPLYQGVAVACAVAAIAVATPWLQKRLGSAPAATTEGTRVDSARPVAQSVSVF